MIRVYERAGRLPLENVCIGGRIYYWAPDVDAWVQAGCIVLPPGESIDEGMV